MSTSQILYRSDISKWTADWLYCSPETVRWENIPRRFTKPIEMTMAPAQKRPLLNWVGVFHPSIKPIDAAALQAALSGSADAATRTSGTVKLIVTLEEHNCCGGFGSAVAEEVAKIGLPVPLEIMAFPDLFVGVGSREDLLALHHLDTGSIASRIAALLAAR